MWRPAGEVECDEPNAKLYSLTGTFRGHIGGVAEPVERAVDETNLLLRGSKLKNTHAIAGLVLYTGKESKFMLNTTYVRWPFNAYRRSYRQDARSPPRKSSNIERLMNKYIFLVLLCQLSFILISAGFGVYWEVRRFTCSAWTLTGASGLWPLTTGTWRLNEAASSGCLLRGLFNSFFVFFVST